MARGDPSTRLSAAVRFAAWMLPPHRRDWAEAMYNEVAYIESRRAALHWALGCMLFAIKARVSFELERAFMSRRILKAVLGIGAASIIAAVGTYMLQKPYQRERILATIHKVFEPKPTPPGK